MSTLSPTKLTSGEETLITFIAFTSTFSICSILLIALRAALHVSRRSDGKDGRTGDSKEILFFQTQLGAYVSSLLIANVMSGAGGLFGFYWSKQGIITPGATCSMQGTLIQIGDFSGAYFTAIIAVHTFQTLVLHKRYSKWIATFITVLGWGSAIALSTALTVISTSKHGPFFNTVGLWCAISSGYTIEQFVAYYLPIIISALVTASLFALIYLCLRGTLLIGDGVKLNVSPENVYGWISCPNGRDEYRYFLGTIIRSLLWFPFAYIVLFLPITIAGLMRISGITNTDALLTVAGISASLVGLANVLILFNTLRILRSAINPRNVTNNSESFFVPEERKPSPIEGPNSSPFGRAVSVTTEATSVVTTPGGHQYGRAFPPPVSRPVSPGSTVSASNRLPPTPRSIRQQLPQQSDERMEHAPTPQMRQAWLHHSRSSSSVDSTTALLRSSSRRLGHSRSTSSSTARSSENIQSLLSAPIIPHSELSERVETGIHLNHRRLHTTTPPPAIVISRPTTPSDGGLSPAPRPLRADNFRSGLLDSVTERNYDIYDVPPVPPLPSNRSSPAPDVPTDFVQVGNETSVMEYSGMFSKTSVSSVLPVDSNSALTHSSRTSMSFDHEDYEIQHVNSREKLRPAISAVARTARPDPYSVEYQPSNFPEAGFSSVTSLPESVTSMSLDSHESEDSLHIELRRRRQTQDNGALSSVALISLSSNIELGRQLSDELNDNISHDALTGLESSQRRLSGFPMVLSSGSPNSDGVNVYVGFNSPRPEAPTPTRMERSGFSLRGDGTSKPTMTGLPSRNLRIGEAAPVKRQAVSNPDPDLIETELYRRKSPSLSRSSSRQASGPEETLFEKQVNSKGEGKLRPSNSAKVLSHSRKPSICDSLGQRAVSVAESDTRTLSGPDYF